MLASAAAQEYSRTCSLVHARALPDADSNNAQNNTAKVRVGGAVTADDLEEEIENAMPDDGEWPELLAAPTAFTPKYLEAKLVKEYHLG